MDVRRCLDGLVFCRSPCFFRQLISQCKNGLNQLPGLWILIQGQPQHLYMSLIWRGGSQGFKEFTASDTLSESSTLWCARHVADGAVLVCFGEARPRVNGCVLVIHTGQKLLSNILTAPTTYLKSHFSDILMYSVKYLCSGEA